MMLIVAKLPIFEVCKSLYVDFLNCFASANIQSSPCVIFYKDGGISTSQILREGVPLPHQELWLPLHCI